MSKKPKAEAGDLHDVLDEDRETAKPKGEKANGAEPPSDVDLGEQIRSAEEEAKQHYDKLLRVMAEFENFKKRMGRERHDLIKYSNEKLLSDLIPSLDDLDRVLDHVPPDATEAVRNLAQGVELVRKSLLAALEKFGLKEVDAMGRPFDPVHHEAIATIESEVCEPGHVVAVHRKGYWLDDRLLRPAMVTVAREAEKAKDEGRETKDEG